MTIRATQPPTHSTTQPRMWTPAAFRSRCLELATTHGAGWESAAFSRQQEDATSGALIWLEVSVASSTIAGLRYPVRYDARHDSAACSCLAAVRGHPCWHAGVALAYGRRVVEERRQWTPQRALASLLDDERWLDNDAALEPSL